ncbi:4-coumarate--CoA ligase 1-like [Pogonomyrmex barbatus]|uniref:4-coumarate--CoA ligase 1-like n=1 Tax=Pogonomyrmex barbatus TaxID=144034 RepID=A0A6I9WTC5_9HYME|nr:4-coumarate--CoA ligase 1-like [Pogonomyrmex barbatus]
MTILQLSFFARATCTLSQCIRECIVNTSPKFYLGKFVKYRHYATAVRLKVDSQNVVSSGFPNVSGFDNIYLHDFVWENVEKWSNRTALICAVTGKSYTYGQLRKACSNLASNLRKHNFLPGDTIAMILPNIPEFALLVLAAHEAGLCTILINPGCMIYELKRQLKEEEIRAIFTFPAKYSDVKASREKNSNIPIILVNDRNVNNNFIFEADYLDNFMCNETEDFSVNEKTVVNYDDTVILPYSSGTTGTPKGVELSHRTIVSCMRQMMIPELFPGRETTEHHQEILPLILPLYHCYGLIVSLYCYLRMGAKLVCLPQFSQEKFMKLLEDYQCTIMYVVPPIIQMMVYNKQITSRHVGSLRNVTSGAAPLGEEIIERFRSYCPKDMIFVQGYGATELSSVAAIGASDGSPTSCGYLIPNTQMRIVSVQEDTLGKNLGPNETGEIYIRGPQVMKGYYKNPMATANTMDGDWYKTGDLGYYAEDGQLYLKGRLKEMIKVKGYQVAPAELEEVIRGYDKIQDVAVIGVPDNKYGEIPKAFIVPKAEAKIDENELKKFVAERLAKYKHLGHVQIIESIPKSMSGKILRRKLQYL